MFCIWSRCRMSRRAPSRRVRNSRSASSVSSCSHQAMVVKSVYCFSSAPLRSSSYIAISPRTFLFQGASFSFDVVGPLHKETYPAAQDLQLPPGWSPVLLVLLSGVPRIARSSSTDGPSTGSAANHDSVRCRCLGCSADPRSVHNYPRDKSAGAGRLKPSLTQAQHELFVLSFSRCCSCRSPNL